MSLVPINWPTFRMSPLGVRGTLFMSQESALQPSSIHWLRACLWPIAEPVLRPNALALDADYGRNGIDSLSNQGYRFWLFRFECGMNETLDPVFVPSRATGYSFPVRSVFGMILDKKNKGKRHSV